MPTLFLSHSGADKAAAIDLKRRLLASPDAQAAGLKVWLDVDDLDEGKPWQAQLESAIDAASAFAVIVGSNGIRNWVRAETDLALSRAVKDESFRIIPILQDGGSDSLTPFVKRYHAVRDPLNDAGAMQRLLRAALGLDKDGLPVLTDAPFPGLRSMSEDWADRFFGRSTETDEVLAMLRRHSAVTIVADSGAGKSSLAMAGVGHAWRGGALLTDRPRADDAAIWHVVTMRPAENPTEQLRDAIQTAAQQMGRDDAAIATYRDKLTSDPAFALRCGLDPAATTTLLIIDQAEELVTLTPRDRRPEFGGLIAALADAMGDRLRILITLRSDHLNLVSGVEGLGPMVRPPEAQFNLKQPVDLPEIVRGPLTLAGHRDEAEQQNLIDRLRTDLSNRPGDLALAQMTLSLAWRDRGKHGGLLAAYAMNRGALAALGNEAERIEGVLSPDDTARLMPIFIRLIRLSEIDTGATRRIAARDEFDADQNRLIDRLAGEEFGRLVQTSAAHVEIAHEALITQWPRLHDYLIAHAGELRTLSDLMRRAQDWVAAGESAKHLTSLADEERFQALRRAQGAWLAPVERRFLDWSKGEHQRIIQARVDDALEKGRAFADRERAILAGKHAIRRGVIAGTTLLVMLLGAGYFALERAQNALTQSTLAAQSRVDALALLALSQAETNPVDALKLVLGAWPEDEAGPFPTTSVAFRAISTALANTRPHELISGRDSQVTSVAFSSDGSRIVSGGQDGTLRLWEATTGAALGVPLRGHESGVTSVAFSPEGSRIVSGSYDGTLRLWDAATGTAQGVSPRVRQTEIDSWVTSVAFSLDGSRIVSGHQDGALRIWDSNLVAVLSTLSNGHSAWISSAAFSPDGSRIVSGSRLESTPVLWDVETGNALRTTGDGHRLDNFRVGVTSVAFSPDGNRIITAGNDGALRFWDGVTGATTDEPIIGHRGSVHRVAFSNDGTTIVSGGEDGSLRLWNAITGLPIAAAIIAVNSPVADFAKSSDGSRIATVNIGLRLWRIASLPLFLEAEFELMPSVSESSNVSGALQLDSHRRVHWSDGGILWVHDTQSDRAFLIHNFGPDGGVNAVAASDDGNRLVVVTKSSRAYFIDVLTGALLGSPMNTGGYLPSFTADDTQILIWDEGVVNSWNNLPPGNLLQVACRYLPHIHGRPDTSTDGLAVEIGIEGLTLPEDCDTYDPPLPPELRQ